jgi:nitrogen fixation protein NifQ
LCLHPMSDDHYQVIMQSRPEEHASLVELLLAGRSSHVDSKHTEWLAYCVAAAATGSRHLWEDLGLSGREDVSALLRHYFEPLFLRNTADLKWKHFFFEELKNMPDHNSTHGPDCTRCSKQATCFPSSELHS